ncbi:uncharacterized protein MEPE_06864 [Melanopsichium pennsylvanicum]|uniref:Cyclase n=1 Tax=Melanopsichium pennsylvanicum TaxID=63383 RepID=A0AAJ5C8W1_9BASI|nr:uncharacterized protein MEPE_06864 [Melanopsichium pennsylvanicum]
MTQSSSKSNDCGEGAFASGNLPSLNDLPPVLAAENIRTGERVQIDWGLDSVDVPANKRMRFHHNIIDLEQRLSVYATDDEVHLNTQTSSQWDGFNHFAHQESKVYYGGVKHEDLHSGKIDKAERNSMHKWCLNGEIIKEVLKWQKTELRTGDVLLLRTGVVRWFEQASDEEKMKGLIENDNFPGIEATEEVKRWIWNSHFAAVASDNMSFEFGPHGDLWLHEWILPMFGCPIGELFDLERLSQACQKHQRWTFFLTSAPIRVEGGIASSPNAICIF